MPVRTALISSTGTATNTTNSGIAYHRPADVHCGRASAINAARADALTAAYESHPERFVHGKPKPHVPPPQFGLTNRNPLQPPMPSQQKMES
jgi:hypothetical protein